MCRIEYNSIEEMKIRLTDITSILENNLYRTSEEEFLLEEEKANIESFLNDLYKQ